VACSSNIYEYCADSFSGLAIDVERQTLYYAANNGKVGELSTNGTNHRILSVDTYSVPSQVVIDVDNR